MTFTAVKEAIMQYVQKTYTYGYDVAESLEKMSKKDLSLVKPTQDPATGNTPDEKAKSEEENKFAFHEKMKLHIKRIQLLEDQLVKVYSLIYDTYCGTYMQSRIDDEYEAKGLQKNDPFILLKTIQTIMHEPARAKYAYAAITDSLLQLLTARQHEKESVLEFSKRFKGHRDLIQSQLGDEILHKFTEKQTGYKYAASATKQKAMKDASFGEWMGFLLLKNSDKARYGKLQSHLATQYSLNSNQYPSDVQGAVDALMQHVPDNVNSKKSHDKSNRNDKDKSDKSVIHKRRWPRKYH